MPRPDQSEPIEVNAAHADRWTQGDVHRVAAAGRGRADPGPRRVAWRGGGRVGRPARLVRQADQADRLPRSGRRFAGAGRPVQRPSPTRPPHRSPVSRRASGLGGLWSVGGVTWNTPPPGGEPAEKPAVFTRGLTRFNAEWDSLEGDLPTDGRRRDESDPAGAVPRRPVRHRGAPAPVVVDANQPSFRSVQLFPRYGAGLKADIFTPPGGRSGRPADGRGATGHQRRRRARHARRRGAGRSGRSRSGPRRRLDHRRGGADGRAARAVGRHAAGDLPGGEHRVPPGGSDHLRDPHVLRRPPPHRA